MALRLVGVGRTVPVTCSFPIFTMLFAFLLWGEAPPPLAILGALLVVAAGALLSLPERRLGRMRMRVPGTAKRFPNVARAPPYAGAAAGHRPRRPCGGWR